MAWSYAGQYGPELLVTAGVSALPLPIPTSATVYVAGTTTLATLYTDALKTGSAPNPVVNGVARNSSGIDTAGELCFFADPGTYDVLCNGVTTRVIVQPNPADLLALFNGGGVAPPTVLQPTADVTITNNNTTGTNIGGLEVDVTAGAKPVHVEGRLTYISTSAAGFAVSFNGPAGGHLDVYAVGPSQSVTNPGGSVHAIDGSVNNFHALTSGGGSTLNAYFGGCTTGGSRQTIRFGYTVQVTTSGQVGMTFRQVTATPDSTTVVALDSYASVYRS